MTTQPLCNFTGTMSEITPTVFVSSHPVDLFYQTQCMYDITNTMCMTSYALHVTSLSQFKTSRLFMYDIMSTLSDLTSTVLCHDTHSIDDITATVCINTHPVYVRHHFHYIYDIISTKYDITILCVDDTTLGICMTSFALQMTMHPLYHNKPQSL